jgi:hypothetical protein
MFRREHCSINQQPKPEAPPIHIKSCLKIAYQSTSIKYKTLFTQTSIFFISCLKEALWSNKLDYNLKECNCNDSETLKIG